MNKIKTHLLVFCKHQKTSWSRTNWRKDRGKTQNKYEFHTASLQLLGQQTCFFHCKYLLRVTGCLQHYDHVKKN